MHSVFPAILDASEDPQWAGWWIDQPGGGVPVLQVAGDPDRLRERVRHLVPEGTELRIVAVERSLADLQAEFEVIRPLLGELRESAIPVTGLKVDIKANQVIASLDPLTEGAKANLRNRFGATLGYEFEPIAEADVDGCASGCMPLKAGLGMVAASDPSDVCTVGYLARRYDLNPDQLVYVTAGHCVEVGTSDGPWKHGSATIGTSLYFAGSLVELFYNHSDGDIGLVKVDANNIPSIKNKLLVDASPSTVYDIEVQLVSSLHGVDMLVCRMGRTTGGPQCGTISNPDATKLSEVPGGPAYWIDHVIVYRRDASGGDSGGTIFYTTGTPATGWATLLGTHVHSDNGYVTTGGKGWYTPWDRGLGQLASNFPVIDLSPCISPTCGF